MNETDLGIATARALRAEQLLNDDLFNEAIDSLKAELILAWEASDHRDQDGRERCWAAVKQVGKLKGYFESVLNDGKLAAAQLKDLAETAERRKRFGII